MSALSERDRATLERAAEIQELRGADHVRKWAGAGTYDITSTLHSYVELAGIAQTVIGDLTDIINRLAGEEDLPAVLRRLADEDEAEDENLGEPEDYRCATCGATISVFIDHGDGWHHYRGNGTLDAPTELYDADHPAVLGGMIL
jgi:hypothetical protein